MKSKILQILNHPVTHFNVLVVGFLIGVQLMHTHAHFTMDGDPDSYCTALERNRERAK
jgi:hypothetical protein